MSPLQLACLNDLRQIVEPRTSRMRIFDGSSKDRLPGRDYIEGMSFGAITEYDTITLIPSLSLPIDGNLCKY